MDTTRPSLLLRIRDGSDAAAWAEFDEIYRPLMERYAKARGLDANAADDIVQQCMAGVYEHIKSFEYDPSKGRFKAWLRTLVNNRYKNLLRDRKGQLAESQDFKRPQEREDGPDETFERLWEEEHLRHCLGVIRSEVEDSTYRAFFMYVIEEQPVEKVCTELGMNANQVHAIKWRLTRRLQQRMQDILGSEM